MKILAFLKAHKMNIGLIDEYCKLLASGVDVIIVFDNKHGAYEKINNSSFVTIEQCGVEVNMLLTDMELYENSKLPGFYDKDGGSDFNKFMWYNGDYTIYIVHNIFPNYDYYWQIEYDVYCNGKSYQSFFNEFEDNYSDFLAVRYAKAIDDWWANDKQDWIYGSDIKKYCCIMPIVRLSNRAIKYLYERRIEHGEIYKNEINNENARWIYCESFLATEIGNNKNFLAEPITTQYITDAPIINLAENRLYLAPDNKLYHPVK